MKSNYFCLLAVSLAATLNSGSVVAKSATVETSETKASKAFKTENQPSNPSDSRSAIGAEKSAPEGKPALAGDSVSDLNPAIAAIEDDYNSITLGILASPVKYQVAYRRRIGTRLLVGGSHFFGASEIKSSEGGNSDVGQYYKEAVKEKVRGYEIDGTYFLKEDGYRQNGFLVRGGVGLLQRQLSADWGRYARDRSLLIVLFGGSRSLVESGGSTKNIETGFAKVGASYQWLHLAKSKGFSGGQGLQLGGSAMVPFQSSKISYVLPNGVRHSKNIDPVELNAELVFTIIF